MKNPFKKTTLPRIKVIFCLSSPEIDVHRVYRAMEMPDAEIRTEFPKNSIAEPWWSIEIEKRIDTFDDPLRELMKRLSDKTQIIKSLCEQYQIVPVVSMIVEFTYQNRPEMWFSKDILAFFADLNAEIGIDPCI